MSHAGETSTALTRQGRHEKCWSMLQCATHIITVLSAHSLSPMTPHSCYKLIRGFQPQAKGRVRLSRTAGIRQGDAFVSLSCSCEQTSGTILADARMIKSIAEENSDSPPKHQCMPKEKTSLKQACFSCLSVPT